ncbi:MAG TPA: hypothetical protein VF263_17510 [Longimicrobiaceae bacterium]
MPSWLVRRLAWLCGCVLPAVIAAVMVQRAGLEKVGGLPGVAFWLVLIWLFSVVPVAAAGAFYLLVLALLATWLPGPDGRPELLLAPVLLVVLLFAGLGGALEQTPCLWPPVAGGFVFAVLAGPAPPAEEGGR